MAITKSFNAGGTGVLTVSFKDENGDAVVPNEASWTLKRGRQIVNDRKDVVIESLAEEVDIVLSGDDLVGRLQCLIVNATYNSTLGNDLPLRDWVTFDVKVSC